MQQNLLQDLVTVIVTFNRALFAQLAQQQFQPPRGYPLPPLNSPAFHACELGMKLTCGFEMVMAKSTAGAVPSLQRPPKDRFTLAPFCATYSSACHALNQCQCSVAVIRPGQCMYSEQQAAITSQARHSDGLII